jgi:hypothetical protein
MEIGKFLARLAGGKSTESASRKDVLAAVDRVAALSDPKLRWASNYRRKLQPAVANALDYLSGLVRKIPEPVTVSKDMWGKNPLISSIFSSGDEIEAVFRSNQQIQKLREQTPAAEIYALLTMYRRDKQVFGTEQQGDLIRRDVPQTAVLFDDHRLVAPSAHEADTRHKLVLRALDLLATEALSQTTALQTAKSELEDQKEILRVKLHLQQSCGRRIDGLLSGSEDDHASPAETQKLLSELDRNLAAIGSQLGSPDDYVERVNHVLLNAGDYLTLEATTLKLNSLGIKASDASADPGREIRFCQLNFREHLSRAAVMVCYGQEAAGPAPEADHD